MKVVTYLLLCHPYIWHIRKKHMLLENLKWKWSFIKCGWKAEIFKGCFLYISSYGHFLLSVLCEGGQVSPAGRVLVFHLMFSCRISHRAVYDSCSAFRSMGVVSSSQGLMFFWVSYRPQKNKLVVSPLYLWAKQLENQTEHLISGFGAWFFCCFCFCFLRGRVQLVMNSSLYLHFCGFKWKDQVKF